MAFFDKLSKLPRAGPGCARWLSCARDPFRYRRPPPREPATESSRSEEPRFPRDDEDRPRPPGLSLLDFQRVAGERKALARRPADLIHVGMANRPCKTVVSFYRNLSVSCEATLRFPLTGAHIGEPGAPVNPAATDSFARDRHRRRGRSLGQALCM